MLFSTPEPDAELRDRLAELDALRDRLGARAAGSAPWMGALRRQLQASAANSSVAIEGFTVPDEAAVAIAADLGAAAGEDQLALAGYVHAMDHVRVMADDPLFRWEPRVLLDLHFDACSSARDRRPGRLRTGGVVVTGFDDGPPAFVGPPAEVVPDLLREVSGWLQEGDLDAHVVVRAAMAHLHAVSVHPFEDGNGRLARIAQSLVLARDGLLSPEFSSIEEHLGRNTSAYYAALQQVQGGGYRPERDALPWVRFCVAAHLAQARRRLEQLSAAAARWAALEALVSGRGWPDRLVIALEQALFGGTERAAYSGEAGVSAASASSDLRRLVDAGLLSQEGRGRVTRYVPTAALHDAPGYVA